MKTDLKELAYAYAMLSHPTRLGVLQALASGPKSIAYLLKTLRQTPNTLGKHLRLLRMSRLVTGAYRGREVFYQADTAALKMLGDAIAGMVGK